MSGSPAILAVLTTAVTAPFRVVRGCRGPESLQ